MKRYLHGVVWIVFTAAVLLTSSPVAGAANQVATGGLYRDGELVDFFVEPIPSLGSSTKGAERTLDAAPASSGTQMFQQRVQPPIPGAETQSRNRVFARAADAGAKMRELLLRMSARRGEYLGTDRQSLQVLLQKFEAMHADVREALSRIGDRVIELGLDQSIRKRHLKTVKAFEQGNKKLRAAIGDVIDGKPGALQRALDLMQRLKFREDPPLLNSGLPFQKHVLEAPRLTRQQADAAPKATALASIPAAPMASAPPTPDDLAETPDIQFTPEITAKAAELGYSPLPIHEFVRNNVSFQAYLGSRKGAANTLEQFRGNDTDQASLLLALLRVSGIPSRYVRGTVEMAPEPTMSWLGVDDAATAASILTTAGLDGVAIVNGPDVVAIRSTHVWVEAYMPYSNYRGIPNDDTGKTWVPIDPSFKGNDITPGEDVLTPMGFDVDSFITSYISTVSDPDPLEQLELDIQAYLDANDPGKTVADIERKRQLAPQLLGLLPASPPYTVRFISDRFSELEAGKRYNVRFHLYDGGTNFIDHTIDLPGLAGKRLTIEYVGATPTDQATIDSFGGIYETPPNLVDVKPVLEIDGVAIAISSNSIGMGYTHSSDMEFIQPAGASNVQPLVQNQIIAGNGQAIGFDTFLDVYDAFLDGDTTFPPEDFLEAILHTTVNDYLSRVDRGMEKAERLMRVVTTQDVSEAIVENAISVSFSFGIPVTFEWTGLIVDADRRIIGTFHVDGDGSQDLPYMKLTGIHGSLMENRVFEEMFDQDAVSTVKILQLASDAGIGICTIQTSVFEDCPGITQPIHIIDAVNAALAEGHVIMIPEDPITVGLWSGTGYIDLDPTTGAGGYIISGGISGSVQTDSGGATVESWPVTLPCEATSVIGDVLEPGADSPDPSAVFCADDTRLSFRVEFMTTCEDGSIQTHQQTFTTSKTKEQIGGGNYTLQLVAFGSTTIIRKISIVDIEADGLFHPSGTVVNLPNVNDMSELPFADQVAHRTVKFKLSPASATQGKVVQWSFTPSTNMKGVLPASHSNYIEQEPGFNFDPATKNSTIASDGTVAVRVNMPPVGFNKGRLKIVFSDRPTCAREVDFEVPVVVVVDPGHGGTASVGGSSPNNAISYSGVLEKAMTLQMGSLVRSALLAGSTRNIKVLMTRTTDINLGLSTRANVARDNGADVFLSIHYNGFDGVVRGTETLIRPSGNDQVNHGEDHALAARINNAILNIMPGPNRGIKDQVLGVLRDSSLGNTAVFHTTRGALCEIDFIDVREVDELLNTGLNAATNRSLVADAIRGGIIDDLENQP